jgi:hypothetical protein
MPGRRKTRNHRERMESTVLDPETHSHEKCWRRKIEAQIFASDYVNEK